MTLWNGEPATAEQLEQLAMSGYGSYTFFQVRERQVRGLQLHLERLTSNALELFGLAPSTEDLLRQISRAVSSDEPCSVRITLVGPDHQRVLSGETMTPDVAITTSAPRPDDQPAMTVRTTRYARETPHVKHRGTHGLTRETRTARQAGYDDALLTEDGVVTEGTTWNLLLHDGDAWVWPVAPMLPGVTASLLRTAMDATGTPYREESVAAPDVPAYCAAFALNSSAPGREITAVDGHALSGQAGAAADLRRLWETVIPEPLA